MWNNRNLPPFVGGTSIGRYMEHLFGFVICNIHVRNWSCYIVVGLLQRFQRDELAHSVPGLQSAFFTTEMWQYLEAYSMD